MKTKRVKLKQFLRRKFKALNINNERKKRPRIMIGTFVLGKGQIKSKAASLRKFNKMRSS